MNSELDVKATCLNSGQMQIKLKKYWVEKPNELSLICAETRGTSRKITKTDIDERKIGND